MRQHSNAEIQDNVQRKYYSVREKYYKIYEVTRMPSTVQDFPVPAYKLNFCVQRIPGNKQMNKQTIAIQPHDPLS